jgi:hypothetical protein
MFTCNRHWYFDGYNVLHAVLLGRERDVAWWHRDFQQRVVTWVETLAARAPLLGSPVTVVFDARQPLDPPHCVSSTRIEVVYAANADDWIVESCGIKPGANVVSADRSLGDRARARGATVSKPWDFEVPDVG